MKTSGTENAVRCHLLNIIKKFTSQGFVTALKKKTSWAMRWREIRMSLMAESSVLHKEKESFQNG